MGRKDTWQKGTFMKDTWMKSKTGMWHMVGFISGGKYLPECQSYNLDRPNYLNGVAAETTPIGAKVCKKCLTHIKINATIQCKAEA